MGTDRIAPIPAGRKPRPRLWLALLAFGGAVTSALGQAAPEPPSVTEIDKAIIVDCFLGRGTVRKVGAGLSVRPTPGQRVRISKLECDTRGGESILYDAANPATAILLWSGPAAEGDREAQNRLGQIYELGVGREPDYAEAAKWYRRAADGGSRAAALNLAALYDRGDGVAKDSALAARYYKLAQAGSPALSETAALREELRDAKQKLGVAQGRMAALEAEVALARATGKSSATVESELAQVKQSVEVLLAQGSAGRPGGALVLEIADDAGARPTITILDPDVVSTRGAAEVGLRPEIKVKDIVGRVRAKNGIAEVRVNNAAASADRFGFFSTSVPVEKSGTRVDVLAVDRKGERETLSFVMQPTAASSRTVTPLQVSVPAGIFGDYHALVIGNRHYRSKGWSELRRAENDARDVAELLRQKYGFKRVQLIVDGTYDQILNAINDYTKALGPADNLLIYYAGHGQIDLGKRGYWIPVDGDAERNTRWILNVQITDLLLKMNARKVLVVSDSCYSGAMAAAENGAVPTLRTGLPDAQRVAAAKGMVDSTSRVMLTSGTLSPVSEGGGGDNSLFARAFLDVLAANDGVIEGFQVFAALEARVLRMAQGRYRDQTPLYAAIQHAGHEGGDFFFVPAGSRR